MKKKVWIMNHYATNSYFNKGGRHYWFAENLKKQGYEPTIICANVRHNSSDIVDIDNGNCKIGLSEEIPFVFVKTHEYDRNGIGRILNMISFYKNLFSVSNKYAQLNGKPDIILASSVHPLTLVAGIKIAKKFGIPCICEVRDLWPESIVAYGLLDKDSLITKVLYRGEKWIYNKADSIIMTWEGGKDYIIDKGWDKDIDINKFNHINNGVAIDTFDINSEKYKVEDEDLDNNKFKNIVYAGSIRKVNNLGILLDVAKLLKKEGNNNIRFLIYGSGDEKNILEERCKNENIDNVIFKGRVEKKYIPDILKRADMNILHNSSTILDKYGQSQNKFFEYLAAGKPVIQTYKTGYSIIDKYKCGISVYKQEPKEIAKAILEIAFEEKTLYKMGINARKAAQDYDFEVLTEKLIDIIEGL